MLICVGVVINGLNYFRVVPILESTLNVHLARKGLKESSDMLFQLCRGASKTVFGQYPKNNACNSFTNLIDVRSQCKVYLGMNEIPLRVREQLRKLHFNF